MKKQKHDKRYASGRAAAAFEQRNNPEPAGPVLYRAELLWKAFNKAGGDYRATAALIGIAVNTLRDAIDGNATKIAVLYQLATHFEIKWRDLFAIDPVNPTKIYK